MALTEWQASRRTTSGRQPLHSDLAIELVLVLRMVFHLALRQAEAFSRSVLGLELAVSGYITLSRRRVTTLSVLNPVRPDMMDQST